MNAVRVRVSALVPERRLQSFMSWPGIRRTRKGGNNRGNCAAKRLKALAEKDYVFPGGNYWERTGNGWCRDDL